MDEVLICRLHVWQEGEEGERNEEGERGRERGE